MRYQNILSTFATNKSNILIFHQMKKVINILCVAIISVILASIILPTYQFGYYFGAGLNQGLQAVEGDSLSGKTLEENTPLALAFTPSIEKITNAPDSLLDTTNGNVLQFTINKGSIFVPNEMVPQSYSIVNLICGLIILVIVVIMIIKFIRLINNINRNKVFERCNVKLLRQLGILMLSLALVNIISGVYGEIIVARLPYELSGYTYSYYWQLPWGHILIGLVSLLMAQIWAKGIQMREEQELTI